jgi:hypothetical protein
MVWAATALERMPHQNLVAAIMVAVTMAVVTTVVGTSVAAMEVADTKSAA